MKLEKDTVPDLHKNALPKKTWVAPTIVLLPQNNINGGNATNLNEASSGLLHS